MNFIKNINDMIGNIFKSDTKSKTEDLGYGITRVTTEESLPGGESAGDSLFLGSSKIIVKYYYDGQEISEEKANKIITESKEKQKIEKKTNEEKEGESLIDLLHPILKPKPKKGEEVRSDKDIKLLLEKIKELDQEGKRLCQAGNIEGALNYYKIAYDSACKYPFIFDRKKLQRIICNRYNDTYLLLIKQKGDEFFSKEYYVQAFTCYQKLANQLDYRNSSMLNNVLNNLAYASYQIGLNEYKKGSFNKAEACLRLAYEKCSNRNKEQFRKGFYNVSAELLNEHGNDYKKQGSYKEAEKYYKLAYNRCTDDYYHKQKFKNNLVNAKAEIFNLQGNKLKKCGNDKAAVKQYRLAYETCIEGYKRKEIFKKKQQDIEGKFFEEEGDKFFASDDYREALKCYREARDLSTLNKELKEVLKEKIANTKAEIFFKEGIKLYEQQQFIKARKEFLKAYELCSKGYRNEQKFKDMLDEVEPKSNPQARKLEKEGTAFLIKAWEAEYSTATDKNGYIIDRSDEAKEKFSNALEKFEELNKLYPDNQEYQNKVSLINDKKDKKEVIQFFNTSSEEDYNNKKTELVNKYQKFIKSERNPCIKKFLKKDKKALEAKSEELDENTIITDRDSDSSDISSDNSTSDDRELYGMLPAVYEEVI